MGSTLQADSGFVRVWINFKKDLFEQEVDLFEQKLNLFGPNSGPFYLEKTLHTNLDLLPPNLRITQAKFVLCHLVYILRIGQ